MLRRQFGLALPAIVAEQRRGVRYSMTEETLKPTPGHDGGSLNMMNEICINAETDEETKRPAWRLTVAPKADEKTYLNTMWKWGYNSLSLFKKVNESAGQWWNANNSTLVSSWTQSGEYCVAGVHCGIWKYTAGVAHFNLRPGEAWGKTYANKRSKKGELRIDYKEATSEKLQRGVFPHLEEHKKHLRLLQPSNGMPVIDSVHGKRVLRELQYQLSQGIRYYLMDGVFGSHPSTSTAFRVVTDNPNSAYFAGMAGVRNRNIVSQEEFALLKRVGIPAMDEWCWRRPGVLVYHCPSYDFEMPRIVEEFGGPRPQDLGLTTPKFTIIDPYSIPMKGMIGAEPSCTHLLDTIALLSARWGYYADEKNYLTVAGDSVLSADGQTLTVVIHNNRVDTNAIRISPQLYGAHHHRIAQGIVSRGWDSTTLKEGSSEPRKFDYVEESLKVIQRPLATHVGKVEATYLSHRFNKHGRHVDGWRVKRKHSYTQDAATRAADAGLLFSAKNRPKATIPRPSAMHINSVNFVVVIPGEGAVEKVTDTKVAAKHIVDGIAANNWLYAESEPLQASFAKDLGAAASIVTVGEKNAAAIVEKLAQNGKL